MYSKENDEELNNFFLESLLELEDFFEFKYNKNEEPKLMFLKDRITIDLIKGQKTKNWVVGFSKDNNVFVLCKENFEKESSHKYEKEYYLRLIKHELVHCFTSKLANYSKKPVWFLEGISISLSNQHKFKKKPVFFSTFLKYYDKLDIDVYNESGFVIDFLLITYGKAKLLELLKKISTINSQNDFEKLFFLIYGFKLNYDDFNKMVLKSI